MKLIFQSRLVVLFEPEQQQRSVETAALTLFVHERQSVAETIAGFYEPDL